MSVVYISALKDKCKINIAEDEFSYIVWVVPKIGYSVPYYLKR